MEQENDLNEILIKTAALMLREKDPLKKKEITNLFEDVLKELGAQRIEAEAPSPKRDHMMRIYDKLDEEYQGMLRGQKLDEHTTA